MRTYSIRNRLTGQSRVVRAESDQGALDVLAAEDGHGNLDEMMRSLGQDPVQARAVLDVKAVDGEGVEADQIHSAGSRPAPSKAVGRPRGPVPRRTMFVERLPV